MKCAPPVCNFLHSYKSSFVPSSSWSTCSPQPFNPFFFVFGKSTTVWPSAFLFLAPYLSRTSLSPRFCSPTPPLKSSPVRNLSSRRHYHFIHKSSSSSARSNLWGICTDNIKHHNFIVQLQTEYPVCPSIHLLHFSSCLHHGRTAWTHLQ